MQLALHHRLQLISRICAFFRSLEPNCKNKSKPKAFSSVSKVNFIYFSFFSFLISQRNQIAESSIFLYSAALFGTHATECPAFRSQPIRFNVMASPLSLFRTRQIVVTHIQCVMCSHSFDIKGVSQRSLSFFDYARFAWDFRGSYAILGHIRTCSNFCNQLQPNLGVN
jgi:hypothetical protein